MRIKEGKIEKGVSAGVGIFGSVQNLWRLPEPITLERLKQQHFHPPQGFRYATISETAFFNEITQKS
jgi:hypothetical protein